MIARLRHPRSVILLVLAVIVLTLAGSPPRAGAQGADTPYTRLRFVNASVDVPNLDAMIDGRLWFSGLNAAVGYMDLEPGEHTFSFRAVGDSEDLALLRVTVQAGQRVTIAAIGPRDALQVLALTDKVIAPPRNAAHVRVVNAVPNAGSLRITLGAKSLADGLDYAHASETRTLFDGEYDLTITDASNQPLLTERARPLVGYRALTLFVTGSAESGGYRVVPAESGVLAPTPSSQFRFAHMAPGIGPVAVFVNNEFVPLYPTVPFSRVTHYYVTGPGEHRFDVYREGEGPGTGPRLASTTAYIGTNESVVFVAHGDGASVALTPFAGDLSPLPGGMTRLQIIHAANGSPALQIERMEGVPMASEVNFLDTSTLLVPAATYNVRFNAADSGTLLMEKTDIELLPGTLTAIIAFEDDPATPLINAMTFSTDYLTERSAVRWAHLNANLPPLDLYLDGERVASDLAPGEVTDYALYTPRKYQLAVHLAGSKPGQIPPLVTAPLDIAWAGVGRTVFLFGGPAEALIEIAPDSQSVLPDSRAQVRFIHAASGATTLSVRDAATGEPVIGGLDYGRASVWLPVEAGTQTFRFELSADVLAPVQAVTLTPGEQVTIVLGGDVRTVGLETFVFRAAP